MGRANGVTVLQTCGVNGARLQRRAAGEWGELHAAVADGVGALIFGEDDRDAGSRGGGGGGESHSAQPQQQAKARAEDDHAGRASLGGCRDGGNAGGAVTGPVFARPKREFLRALTATDCIRRAASRNPGDEENNSSMLEAAQRPGEPRTLCEDGVALAVRLQLRQRDLLPLRHAQRLGQDPGFADRAGDPFLLGVLGASWRLHGIARGRVRRRSCRSLQRRSTVRISSTDPRPFIVTSRLMVQAVTLSVTIGADTVIECTCLFVGMNVCPFPMIAGRPFASMGDILVSFGSVPTASAANSSFRAASKFLRRQQAPDRGACVGLRTRRKIIFDDPRRDDDPEACLFTGTDGGRRNSLPDHHVEHAFPV